MGLNWFPASAAVTPHKTFAMLKESTLVIELELFVLGCSNSAPILFRVAPSLAVLQRMSGRLLGVRPSVSKILQYNRFPSAIFFDF